MNSENGLVYGVSSLLGISEPAFRLFISVIAGYPVASIHRRFIRNLSPVVHHIFFVISGICIAYFNYGVYCMHHVVCILSLYATLKATGGTVTSVIISFIFQFLYLLIGYICYQTKDYDITWCTSHCVLTLKLIGVAFDVYDGHKDPTQLRRDERDSALSTTPDLLTLSGHALFPCALVAGPQFSMRLYQRFTSNAITMPVDETGLPASVGPAMRRLSFGFIYVILHVLLTAFLVPDQYFFDDKFLETSFIHKLFFITLWQRASFMRYLVVWLMAEGSCILIGLSYNGEDKLGVASWDGLTNINIRLYENAHCFQDYIAAFNINTNRWVAKYVFKRLAFMGSKELSQIISLLFLSVWHGYHLGYTVVFSLEFFVVYWERKMQRALYSYPSAVVYLRSGWRRPLTELVLRSYTWLLFAYCSVPFLAVSRHRWWPLYLSLYFYGHVLFLSWRVTVPAVHALMRLLAVPRVEADPQVLQSGQRQPRTEEQFSSDSSTTDQKEE